MYLIKILSISAEHYPSIKVDLPIIVKAMKRYGFYMVDVSELEKKGVIVPDDCYEVTLSPNEVSVLPTNVKIGYDTTVKNNHYPWR